MNASTIPTLLALAATTTVIRAGTPASPSVAAAPEAPWLQPLVDIRLRYEFADIDGLDPAHSLTTRERLGLKTKAWHGFSALVEGEFTQAIVDDYHGGAPGAEPFDPRNSVIADPETNELNQAFLQYSGFDTTLRFGRQQIVYDNAAHIGDVIWRQNQQTYDAFSVVNTSVPGLTVKYALANQVNRIFGSDATGIFSNAPGELHLLNASYAGIQGLTLGGYVYLMEFDDAAAAGFNNDTFGLSAKGNLAGLALHGELAWQDKAGALNNEEGLYAHFTATKTLGPQAFTLGLEHLDAGVQTPLSTVHAFNGYADATDGRRVAGTHGGLTDTYLSHSLPIFWGMKWINTAHIFGDNAIGTDLGFGFDSVLVKKFDNHLTAIGKLGYFDTGDALYKSTTRVTVELNYAF